MVAAIQAAINAAVAANGGTLPITPGGGGVNTTVTLTINGVPLPVTFVGGGGTNSEKFALIQGNCYAINISNNPTAYTAVVCTASPHNHNY
jgi:hypothetical protein